MKCPVCPNTGRFTLTGILPRGITLHGRAETTADAIRARMETMFEYLEDYVPEVAFVECDKCEFGGLPRMFKLPKEISVWSVP